jgi:exodeoxyribonuclease VII large subunit
MDDVRPLPFDDDDYDVPGTPAPPLSVSELNARLKGLVERSFGGITVEGEISNCKAWSSGHIYFTLKDDFAQVRAVLFRTQARQLKFRLEDGLHVVIGGRLSVYEVKGEYQLIADTVAPHGLGALQAAFEQLKKRLLTEGLFDSARKRAVPALPRRIGIVTSADGAALRDILRILTTRHPSARIVIRSARVQGEDAAVI